MTLSRSSRKMNDLEWNKLNEMHNLLNETGLMSFDSAFLECYTELLAKSLEGKSDEKPQSPLP
jgi:hypothetical protein